MKPPPKTARPRPFTGWVRKTSWNDSPVVWTGNLATEVMKTNHVFIRVRVTPLPNKRRRKAK